MKKNNKKGFTIVELVIVIAVIAILAAVLIPTFSSVTQSAKESAARQQAKSSMQAVLALTSGTMPTGTKFYVSENDNDTDNYAYVYKEQKLQQADIKEKAEMAADTAYMCYISPKAIIGYNAGTNAVPSEGAKLKLNTAKRMAKAMGVAAPTEDLALTMDTASLNFYTCTIGGNNVQIYWTSDIETSLIVFLGSGKIAEETVNVTFTDKTGAGLTAMVGSTELSTNATSITKETSIVVTVSGGSFTADQVEVNGANKAVSGNTITLTDITGDITIEVNTTPAE